MPHRIFDRFDSIPHLATFALAIHQFTQPSHCSPSFSVPTPVLAFLSLLPIIYASTIFVKESLDGFPQHKFSDEGSCIPLRGDLEQRCPGHLDTMECLSLSEASLPEDLSHESTALPQPSSTHFKYNETNHGDAALLLNPHVLASPQGARASDTPPGKTFNSRSRPSLRKVADLELSAVGQHLARQFGMFAWRIYPLIHAHNAATGLDASFRRLDMFMHSPRAGMLYHEMIIFVDHAAITRCGSSEGHLQTTWQMYAARTRACDLSDPDHMCFHPVDGDEYGAGQEWQNSLQWDALMTRVLNAAYMRRAGEAVIQRWDVDARQYWRRVEGLSEARIDRVAMAVLVYGRKSSAEVTSYSSGLEVDRGIQTGPQLSRGGEHEDNFLEDEFGGVVDLSCGANWQSERDKDVVDRGSEVNATLYEFDFEEELSGGDLGFRHDLDFQCDGGLGPECDFGSLDSVLSDATPPPASLTPSSSEASSSDQDSERILYPRRMPTSTPISHQCFRPPSRTRIYPALVEERPSLDTSGSSERILADFSAFSLAHSTRTSTGMNARACGPLLSSSQGAATAFDPQSAPARPYEPSLLDLALALGTRGSEERLRKRELTSSSSYPSPPPSPSPQLLEDRCPQVPRDMGEITARDIVCIHSNDSTLTSGSFRPAEELPLGHSYTRMDSPPLASISRPLHSPRKLRLTLNLTFRNPPSDDPAANPAPVPVESGSAIPRLRTAFSLSDVIMRPQCAPVNPSGSPPASVDMRLSDVDSNSQASSVVDCDRKPAACLQAQPVDKLVGVYSQRTGVGVEEFSDTSDGEWQLVTGRNGKTTRSGGEKARGQRAREKKRIRIEVKQI